MLCLRVARGKEDGIGEKRRGEEVEGDERSRPPMARPSRICYELKGGGEYICVYVLLCLSICYTTPVSNRLVGRHNTCFMSSVVCWFVFIYIRIGLEIECAQRHRCSFRRFGRPARSHVECDSTSRERKRSVRGT